MRWRPIKQYSFYIFSLCFIAIIGGCNGPTTCWTPPAESKDAEPDVVRAAEVYVDATPSQRGYASAGSEIYAQLPDYLRGAARSIADSIQFFRFGTERESLEWSAFRRFGIETGFYGAGSGLQDTRIEQVAGAADSAALSIVITDLFQDAADINVLSEELSKKYLSHGAAVGVVGFKVPFRGRVYDIGVQRAHVSYSGERPLYVLAMGPTNSVSKFVQQFIDELPAAVEAHALTFGPHLTSRRGTTSDARVDSDSTFNVNETSDLLCGDARDERLRQFEVLDLDGASVAMSVPYEREAFAQPFDGSKLEARTVAYRINEDSPVWSDSSLASVQRAFQVRSSSGGQEDVRVVLEVNGYELTQTDPGLYYVRADIVPMGDAFSWPSWVNEWSSESTKGFEGARTLNLRRLLEDLHQESLEASPPSVAQLHYLVNVTG